MNTRLRILVLTLAALLIAPSVASAAGTATITGTPAVGETLTCEDTGLLGSITYTWKDVADGRTIALGASGDDEFEVELAEAGLTITCTATNNDLTPQSATSAPVKIAEVKPAFEALSKLDVSRSTDQYTCRWTRQKLTGGNIATAYAWYLDSVVIAGQTSSTLPRSAFYGKGQIYCTITATNAAGATTLTAPAEAGSSEDPKPASNPTISGDAKVGATLTCSGGSFTRPGWTLEYDWTAGSTNTVLGTGTTLVVPASSLGGAVRCRLHAKAPGYDETVKSEDLRIPAPALLTLAKTQPKRTLQQALALGVTTSTVLPTTGCTRTSQLTIPAKLAKQLKLLPKKSTSSAPFVISAASAKVVGVGTKPVNVKLSAPAKAAIAKLAKITVTHAITATCTNATPVTITRTVVLVKAKPVAPKK